MKTKQVPAIVMLVAGFITCIIAIVQGMEIAQFTKTLLVVLICFYILGCIAKVVLDKNFPEMQEEEALEESEESEAEGDEESMENVNTEEENKEEEQ